MSRFRKFIDEEAALHQRAAEFAEKAHAGQTRKFSGRPYVTHPQKVAQIVMNFKKSKNLDALMAAGHLHDTIEDTDTDYEVLQKEFGNLVASLVKELTSDGEELKKVGKTKYLTDKMINMSDYGLVIKLADRLQNIADLASGKPSWAEKYATETENIMAELTAKRKLTNSQSKLVKAIVRTLKEFRSRKDNPDALQELFTRRTTI